VLLGLFVICSIAPLDFTVVVVRFSFFNLCIGAFICGVLIVLMFLFS
jgi:hypothetical protein